MWYQSSKNQPGRPKDYEVRHVTFRLELPFENWLEWFARKVTPNNNEAIIR